MSNLTETVKFDVVRGWPFGGAIEDSYGVTASETLKEGRIVTLASTGLLTGTLAAPPDLTVAIPAQVFMVIQGNDQYDGKFVRKAVVLRGNFTVKTEKYVSTNLVVGSPLTWDETDGDGEGYLILAAAKEQVIGYVESIDATAGVLTANMSI